MLTCTNCGVSTVLLIHGALDGLLVSITGFVVGKLEVSLECTEMFPGASTDAHESGL